MKVIIPSKGRPDSIAEHSLRLFPHAVVCVDEREVPAYARTCPRLWPHPPMRFLPQIRNWILDHVDDEDLMMIDDDCMYVMSKTGMVFSRYTDPAAVMQICENALECAKGIGAHLFGFSQVANPIYGIYVFET